MYEYNFPNVFYKRVRPYLAGSVELPEWLEPELFAAIGPGVAGGSVAAVAAKTSAMDLAVKSP